MPEKLQLYGLYVYYVVHICDFGMLRVKWQALAELNSLAMCNALGLLEVKLLGKYNSLSL